MNYILLILLFVTPPTQIDARDKFTQKDQRVWALQSSTTMELETKEWCKSISKNIDESIRVTDTINVRMYCIPRSVDAYYGVPPQNAPVNKLSEEELKKFNNALKNFRSNSNIDAFRKELKEQLPSKNDELIESLAVEGKKFPSQTEISKAIRMNK